MHFLLYFPGAVGANPQHLVAAGLGHLLGPHEPAPAFAEVLQRGPDGGAGLLAGWGTGQIAHLTAQQTWRPAKPDPARNLPAGRYWLGLAKDSPPTPAELQKAAPLAGFAIVLGDGCEWQLPNCFRLPHTFALADDGMPQRQVVERHAALYEKTRWAFRTVEAFLESGVLDWPPVLEYLLDMLQQNYRMPRELAFALKLFDESNIVTALAKTTDIDKLREIQEALALQKKTEPPASTPPG